MVRQRVLVPSFAGSIPADPARKLNSVSRNFFDYDGIIEIISLVIFGEEKKNEIYEYL